MKNKIKQTALLVLSCASLVATIGYSSWIVQSHKEYSLVNHPDVSTKPVAYIVGNEKIKYSSIERALEISKSGDIVCVIPPTTGSVTYEITRNCIVPDGVTLVLPTSKASFDSVQDKKSLDTYIKGMIEVPDGAGNCNFATESNKKIVVKVRSGITMVNKGTIVIAGTLTGGNNGAGSIGQTSGDYSELILGDNSKIEQKENSSANLYCFGFLNEETVNNGSEVSIFSGLIYLPFVVNDYRGFSYSYALSQGGGVSKKGCSAFNRYEFPNVSSKLKVIDSGEIKGIVNILINFPQANVKNQVSHETLSLVGFSSNCFINLLTNSIFEYKFNKITRNATIDITDGCTIGNLAFKASVGSFTADMNTSSAYFPVPYTFSITLKSSNTSKKAIFNSEKQNIKFLPGTKINVSNNCEVKSKSIAIYSAFLDGTIGDGKIYKNSSNKTRYPVKPGAIFQLANDSTLSASSIGGTIYCDDSNNIVSDSNDTLCNEPWSTSGGLAPSFTEYLEIRESKSVVPSNYLSKKKIYFFSNCFANNNKYLPKTNFIVNGNTNFEINGIQKVLFVESIHSCQMKFESNIYNALYSQKIEEKEMSEYSYEEDINDVSDESLFGVINSTVSISNSNNGVNEFEVQAISISSTQDKIDGKDPLYVDGELGLKANIVNSTKVYNPNVTWKTSDNSIATIDSEGVVHGIKLGKVTIYAECHGKKASYDTEVITKKQSVEITNIWLQSSNGKKSNDLKGNSNTIGTANDGSKDFAYNEKVTKNTTITITLNLEPSNGQVTGIGWSFKAWGGQSYMKDPNDSQRQIRDFEDDYSLGGEKDASIKSVDIVFDTPNSTGTGKSPDSDTLKCTVYYGDNQQFDMTFVFDHDHFKACIVAGTLITLSDGSTKKVEDLLASDSVLVFNHELGKTDKSMLFFNYHEDEDNIVTAPILTLLFDNFSSIDIHVDHGFFDLTIGKYVYINKNNYLNFLGHDFVFIRHGKLGKVKLLSGNLVKRTVRVYSPVSVYHLNVVTNGLLSITGEIEGWFNYFDYDSSLKYDEDKMQKDIQKYGLYSYDDFKDYIRKEIYDLLPIPYLKISVGKGLTTKEKIIEVMKKYLSFM